MDEETIRRLAKETVARFMEGWEDTADTKIVERGEEHIMVVTPNIPVPYASLHLNLEMQIEEWIRFYLPPDSVAAHPHATGHLFEAFLQQMVANVPTVLFDFLVLLNFVKARAHIEAAYGALSETLAESGVEAANKYIQDMLQRYKLAKNTRPGRRKSIDTDTMLSIIRSHLIDVNNGLSDKAQLSQNRLAKELKTTPAAVRAWLRKRGYKSLEDLIADFDEHFHRTVGPNCRMKKGKRGGNN